MGRRRHSQQRTHALIAVGSVIILFVAFAVWNARRKPQHVAKAPAKPQSKLQADVQAELLAGMSLSGAPEAEGNHHPIGLDLFQAAVVGDWSSHRLTNAGPLGTIVSTIVWRVESREEESIGFHIEGLSGDEKGSYQRTFSTRVPLTVEILQDMPRTGWRVLSMSSVESSESIDGRSFSCLELQYSSSDPLFPEKVTKTTMCISGEVLGSGVVVEREVQTMGEHKFVLTSELLGYGKGNEVLWGVRPDWF